MHPVDYVNPADIPAAVRIAAGSPGARFLAGGTNLVDLMREGIEQPGLLVDVTGLPLEAVEDLPDGGLRIGALARNSPLAADRRVRERYPVVAAALLAGAPAPLADMATRARSPPPRHRPPLP